MAPKLKDTPLSQLEAFDQESGLLNVVIETPKGSRNKFKYDEQHGLFTLVTVLPAGAVFPYDFGYVPGTVAADGDPLDVLLLMDEPVFPGCLVASRLLGVIEARQSEEAGKKVRNDRLIAVADKAPSYQELQSLSDMRQHLLTEIEHFFTSYNQMRGKQFEPQGRHGPARAKRLVQEALRNNSDADA